MVLDWRQSFDTVSYEKLLNYRFRMFAPETVHRNTTVIANIRIGQENAFCGLKEIKVGLPRRSVLRPVLYLLYASYCSNSCLWKCDTSIELQQTM